MNQKFNPNEKLDQEQEDALEFYMRRCSILESENQRLREIIDRLRWSMEEHD